MIFINAKKKNNKKFKKYWRTVYPENYVDKMVAGSAELVKIAYSSKKKEIKLEAKLKTTKDGFGYLDMPNDILFGLFSLLNEENIEKPPYFGKGKIGGHVSVISTEENPKNKLNIKEIGKEFSFTLGKTYSVKPEGWKEMDRVWFVEIICPELKELRKKYDLPPTYKDMGHEFHCTFAVRFK